MCTGLFQFFEKICDSFELISKVRFSDVIFEFEPLFLYFGEEQKILHIENTDDVINILPINRKS